MATPNGAGFPEAAPLVFPTLDKLDDSNSGEAKTNKEKLKGAISSLASISIAVSRQNIFVFL
jgi:hypothetical protein